MALRNIVKLGDPILYKKSREVTNFDEKLATIIDDMIDTLKEADGCGLAAVQVGLLKRICIVDVGEGVIELVNPVITKEEGIQEEQEGCLSLPNKWGTTRRPKKVQVKAQDRNGKWQVLTGEDLKARAFCHEIDHLDGILFTSHIIDNK